MQTHCKSHTDYQSKVIKELEEAPNVTYIPWTEFEIKILKQFYGKKSKTVIAKALNRTIRAVDQKAFNLGLSYKKVGE
jgi:hypothetical protein